MEIGEWKRSEYRIKNDMETRARAREWNEYDAEAHEACYPRY